MRLIKTALLFCLIVLPLSGQSTYFLDFNWDKDGISLQNSEKVDVNIKSHKRSYLSDQNLYFELTDNGKQVYWSTLPHPLRVHVEYSDENGNLYRQESFLESSEFTIRIPARFRADAIRFFTLNPDARGKIKNEILFSDQPILRLVEKLTVSIKPE